MSNLMPEFRCEIDELETDKRENHLTGPSNSKFGPKKQSQTGLDGDKFALPYVH